MKYRMTEVLDEIDPGAAGTHVIPLNLRDPITRLTILYTVHPLSTAMIAAQAANILKIELTDGSDIIYSLSGYEAQALAFYDRMKNALSGPDYIRGSAQTTLFPIDFGRFKYDPELALVPDRFHNLLLKITYNEDLMDASVDDHHFEIFADCFDEKTISPQGYLSAKEWIDYTPSAINSYKAVDLPTDEVIRRIQVRAYKEKKDPEAILAEVRLTEEEKKRVVFDWKMYQYYHVQLADEFPILERMFEYAADDGTYDKFAMMTDYMGVYATMPNVSTDVWVPGYNDGGFIERRVDESAMVGGILLGRLPHHTYDFPMGNPQDITDWYDVTNKGSVILRLRAAGTVGTHQVVLQQFRRY